MAVAAEKASVGTLKRISKQSAIAKHRRRKRGGQGGGGGGGGARPPPII